MWTRQHRKIYKRVGGRYSSDLTDAEWARLAPLIPAAKPGRAAAHDRHAGGDGAILYLRAPAARGAICRATASRRDQPLHLVVKIIRLSPAVMPVLCGVLCQYEDTKRLIHSTR
jgi:hypothetical protein